jgi:putative hydroxymethylpyrimidine transport system ATP-binding protein
MRVIVGVQNATSGTVTVCGKTGAERKGLCAYLPQGVALLPWRTVQDNARLGYQVRAAGTDQAPHAKYAEELLEAFQLGSLKTRFPATCSGGERQRVALVRTLATPSPILVFDEPMGSVDQLAKIAICDVLRDHVRGDAARVTTTMIVVSHDPMELLLLCDRILIMQRIQRGPLSEFVVTLGEGPRSALRTTKEFTEQSRALWALLQ